MLGHNEIVGRKFFNEANGRLLVTSIFLTLQGEGPFMGRPAVFVRLAKCNLACSFCDTYFDTGDWMGVEEVVVAVAKAATDYYIRIGRPGKMPRYGVVITGGEPSLQPELAALCEALQGAAFIQIESNGMLPITTHGGTALVVSPKCVEAYGTGKALGYMRPHRVSLENATCLKFVVTADRSSPYHGIPQWAHDWAETSRRYIYISPMNCYKTEPLTAAIMRTGRQPTMQERNENEVVSFWTPDLLDLAANEANHKFAAKFALDHGYFLSLQMHLLAGIA